MKNSFGSDLFKSLFLPLYYISLGKESYLKIERLALSSSDADK